MKVAELLENRRTNWRQLELLCVQMEGHKRRKLGGRERPDLPRSIGPPVRISPPADAYQLPANTVGYLHQFVAAGTNQLYRSRRFDFPTWGYGESQAVPRRLRADRFYCVCAANLPRYLIFFLRVSPD